MHNRLKIKTSAEQQAAKKLEQEKKLKVYKAGTQRIFEKRENGEHDEEALSLTGEFLAQNPDFYTLWNFRREILISMKPEKSEDDLKKMGTNELMLTQTGLKKNPKSYNAWHHRAWAMDFFPGQDWSQELKLCNLFLSMDERNFHCWDYRRIVVNKCSVKPSEELKFTLQLIEKNFSNYSAWHYRSKLLPVVHPGSTHIGIDEETLLKEYEIVQNAAFTDPNDQSVWFYHRWLLGRGNERLEILNVAAMKAKNLLTVLMSCPIKVNEDCTLKVVIGGSEIDAEWSPIGGVSGYSTLWVCNIPSILVSSGDGTAVSVEAIRGDEKSSQCCKIDDSCISRICSYGSLNIFSSEISSATKDVLAKELDSCRQLYELEPDDKWTIFTCMLLMKAFDSQAHHQEICQDLDKLTDIDTMRSNYYRDLRSKTIIEHTIENLPSDTDKIDLSNKRLSSLHHFDHFYLVKELDLSSNDLSSLEPLCYLLCIEVLILDGNKITNCDRIKELSYLRHLSLKSNCIAALSDIQSLKSCTNLRKLFLDGNPVVSVSDYEIKVKDLLGDIILDGNAL